MMEKAVLNNAKIVGNGWFEVKCTKCGEVLLVNFADIDSLLVGTDVHGGKWAFCERCHPGPQADCQTITEIAAKMQGENGL